MTDLLRCTYNPLDCFFNPKSVAIIGASEKPGVGNTLLFNLVKNPFNGVIYPINPRRESVHGFKCYKKVSDVPEPVDLALIVIPARFVPAAVADCAAAKVKGIVIISAGFKEMGPPGIALEEEIMRVRGDCRIVGPNVLGVMNPLSGLNATFAADMALPGKVAFLSQSGAMCTAVLDWSLKEKIGFSAFVSVGSMLDVDWGDLISYFGNDPNTEAIVIYMESIGNAKSFFAAARQVALSKPIIVIKAGATEAGSAAAASHTGTLAGSDKVLDAAFRRCGVLRVHKIADLFHMAATLAKQPRPHGNRLTIITNAGGPGVLTTDALISSGGVLSEISPETLEQLNKVLPDAWSHGNPVDILGDALPDRYADSLAICAKDPNNDGTLVILTPQDMSDPTATAQALVQYARTTDKPILASWMGGTSVNEGIEILTKAGIPVFSFPDEATDVFNLMYKYHKNLLNLYEEPYVSTDFSKSNKAKAQELINVTYADDRTIMSEHDSKNLLHSYGIPVARSIIAETAEAAAAAATELGFPVVVKIHSEIITHKSDVGGVQLNLKNEEEVKDAFNLIEANVEKVKDHYPAPAGVKHFLGVTVQPMVKLDGYEIIIGMNVDPQLGPTILFGTGGTLVEVYADTSIELPPLSKELSKQMMARTKIYTALKGVRGKPPVDIDVLADVLVNFSNLIVDNPQIKELDINPLIASHEGIIALDARVLLHDKKSNVATPVASGYPSGMSTTMVVEEEEIVIRPIRPSDYQGVKNLHDHQTVDSSYRKFFANYDLTSKICNDRLTRMCLIDYDTEIAFVAEKNGALLGISRLSCLPNGNAEFSLVVDSSAQKGGLGATLYKSVEDFAKMKGAKKLFGQVSADNEVGRKFVEKRGFNMHESVCEKNL
eukprot:TRINITY_DN2954_c0_g1_i1.p1 TRINITY_DN2954_c0_g1~~TRINITY_DN2954_c0_g1_i1.p1  ORF type:complete len:900 (+),score=286.68 TRINITY_DN2954_c0_g1_i1:34-2700(+)